MSAKRIASVLGVGVEMVQRAYDYGHPEIAIEAAEKGETPRRGRYSHLGKEKFKEIRSLLRQEVKVTEIAKRVGCGTSTVYRVSGEMNAEAGEDQAT